MRIAIALNENLDKGLLANAAACIASGLFNEEKDLLGPEITSEVGKFIAITKIPVLILKQNNKPFDDTPDLILEL